MVIVAVINEVGVPSIGSVNLLSGRTLASSKKCINFPVVCYWDVIVAMFCPLRVIVANLVIKTSMREDSIYSRVSKKAAFFAEILSLLCS